MPSTKIETVPVTPSAVQSKPGQKVQTPTPTLQDFLNNFPKDKVRPVQKYALQQVANAIAAGKKFLIMEAPTGFGKSPVAVAIAKTLGSSFICTTTKTLQEQYAADFPDVKKVLGSKNFHCSLFTEDHTAKGSCSAGFAAECPDRKDDEAEEFESVEIDGKNFDLPPCPYVKQKVTALSSKQTLLNYHYFLSLLKYTKEIKPGMKKLLIADEAHDLPTIIKDFHSLSLSQYWLRQILPGQTIPKLGTSELAPWVTLFENLLSAIEQVQDVTQKTMLAVSAIASGSGDVQKVTNIIHGFNLVGVNWRHVDAPAVSAAVAKELEKPLERAKSKQTLLNYHYFLSLLKYTKEIKPGMKKLLIADEAHDLPTIIKDFHSLSLSQYWLRQILPGQTIPKLGTSELAPWVTLFENLLSAIEQVQDVTQKTMLAVSAIASGSGDVQKVTNIIHGFNLVGVNWRHVDAPAVSAAVAKELEKPLERAKAGDTLWAARMLSEKLEGIETVAQKLRFFLDVVKTSPNTWVIDAVPDSEDPEKAHKIQLLPLNVDKYAREVFCNTDYTLLMSATILDVKTFARTLGLDESEYAFIQVASTFPAKNRPIMFRNVGRLSYSELQGNLPKVLKEVESILDSNANKKGIIHTHTKAIMTYIYDNISAKHKHRLIQATADSVIANSDDNQNGEGVTLQYQQRMLQQHAKSTAPTVLISPSLHTGIDLKGDLSRFQIIVKTPYPSLADNWIAKKREVDPQWYKWQVALRLIQMYGRSIRSDDDWAYTYVLDSLAQEFMFRNARLFPQWLREAYTN